MSNNKVKTVINARFDTRQLGSRFTARITRTIGDDQPVEGVFAGSLYFQRGEELYLSIVAGAALEPGGKQPFKNFEVVDCSFTTRPRVYSLEHETRHVKFAPASPFTALSSGSPRGATTVLAASEFVPVDVPPGAPDYFTIGRRWDNFMTMGQNNARWLLTLLATVKIEHNDGKVEYRVMEIDPETEVGTGTLPPP